MAEFSIGQTVVVNDELRIIHDVDCNGMEYMYETFPVEVQKRIDANPDLMRDPNFRYRYCRWFPETSIKRQTRPQTLRVPTQLGVLVVQVVEPACAVPMIVTRLELPDGSERELSKVFGYTHQDKVDINLLDGNRGYAIHKATYTGKSLNIKKEEPNVSDETQVSAAADEADC